MNRRTPLLTVALALMGVLAIAAGLMVLGKHEDESFPSAHSYLPSGTAALMELFKRSGYQVTVDTLPQPKLRKGDLAIAFYNTEPTSLFSQVQSGDNSGDDSDRPPDPLQPTKDAVQKFVDDGGSVITLPVFPDFPGESSKFLNSVVKVKSPTGDTATVNWDGLPPNDYFLQDSANHQYSLWSTNPSNPAANKDLVTLYKNGKGYDAVVADGLLASNRFIDRNENAKVLVSTAHALAKPGARVVFVEAAFGNVDEPGLMDLIGPWAKAAWFQFVFLVIVAIYTLGKPFGLPDAEVRPQKGSRELLDAMADTLRRGRMTRLALRSVYEDTNRLLRKWFRTPRDTGREDAEAQSLISLHHALNRVQAALEIGAPEEEAARMVRDVERHVREVAASGSHAYKIGH